MNSVSIIVSIWNSMQKNSKSSRWKWRWLKKIMLTESDTIYQMVTCRYQWFMVSVRYYSLSPPLSGLVFYVNKTKLWVTNYDSSFMTHLYNSQMMNRYLGFPNSLPDAYFGICEGLLGNVSCFELSISWSWWRNRRLDDYFLRCSSSQGKWHIFCRFQTNYGVGQIFSGKHLDNNANANWIRMGIYQICFGWQRKENISSRRTSSRNVINYC